MNEAVELCKTAGTGFKASLRRSPFMVMFAGSIDTGENASA